MEGGEIFVNNGHLRLRAGFLLYTKLIFIPVDGANWTIEALWSNTFILLKAMHLLDIFEQCGISGQRKIAIKGRCKMA